ncbi:hypothetical protein [Aeromonas simiae]|uniref:hypothetical protein n=1 Tax=Aeromonas simiae TaxID=218936 RepID=UPI00266BFA12|nr:hypothetical protein [Aeromonas simiae]MDO2948959.1 DNA polymerase III subunit psi [Aeromonas simiae]MDO2952447.1 DNA polymerase III subunit psi [Aeromonas simiae]MDO2956647.1 DNA polymerase III subunit psi [Aeromonas simiae]
MQDPAPFDQRPAMLARMGIPTWQSRLSAGVTAAPAEAATAPAGRLWLRAERLPAPAFLGDLCALLGLSSDEVSLLPPGPLPAGQPEWLLLTEPDAAHPAALVCPLNPDAAAKRALWHQLRSLHA